MKTSNDITFHEKKVFLFIERLRLFKPLVMMAILTITFLILGLLLPACDSNEASEIVCPEVKNVNEFRSLANISSPLNLRQQLLPFTGRDSFGIALDIEVSGDIESVSAGGDSSLVELTGRGQSDLMGEIEVSHIHYVNHSSNEISGGRFTVKGEHGDLISGTYSGTRTPGAEGFTLEARANVNGGYVGCTPTNLESGWGWINGALTDSQFDYQMEGWLFHHAEVNE